ncbi:sulfatase/phosphatase domain-containing protein [Xanthocytophaga flava]|uniref:sulfatase/phosphatase domain-containing protein n=1 Tax=Xanthocytophaga flava TaxID=3048013 RepID=UPI0036F2EE1D
MLFHADQGHSEEGCTFWGGYSSPYHGSKFSLFEGGIKVPAIIWWPGHVPANAVRDQFDTNIDWYPTLAEYCGIKLPQRKLDGASWVKVIPANKGNFTAPCFLLVMLGYSARSTMGSAGW